MYYWMSGMDAIDNALRPAIIGYGLSVMATRLLVDYLPSELESIIGARQASAIIARVTSRGAYEGFLAFLEKLGTETSMDVDSLLRLFVKSSEQLHPFQVFTLVEKSGENYILRFDERVAEMVKSTPSIAAVFGGVIAGCLSALGLSARFVPGQDALRAMCLSKSRPKYIVISQGSSLMVRRLRCDED